jgi:hypothetical protein
MVRKDKFIVFLSSDFRFRTNNRSVLFGCFKEAHEPHGRVKIQAYYLGYQEDKVDRKKDA